MRRLFGDRVLLVLVALSALTLGACRQDMHDQPKYEPLEETFFFDNGAASRELVEGTVARGHLGEDVAYQSGLEPDGSFAAQFPMPSAPLATTAWEPVAE